MRKKAITSLVISILLVASSTFGQELAKKEKNKTVTPFATSSVDGSGTPGRISKWTGVSGSNTYVLGNSNIFEDKFGKIGIGTTTPTSLLTVQGMIEITMGGLKFPDGTVQTTAFNAGQVVRSLNGLTGDVQLVAGANITITPAGNTLTIAATNALTGVAHDETLKGNGTVGSPLGVAVPLVLTGSSFDPIVQASNIGQGPGVMAKGGHESVGVIATGGPSATTSPAGTGVDASGGDGGAGSGGIGVFAEGGSGGSGGGQGVVASGGQAINGAAGTGVESVGGKSSNGDGGSGVFAIGGQGNGAGNSGGSGIFAFGGSGVNGATIGLAGRFFGNVAVSGTLSKGGGSFKIDHPLDPENMYLYHSFVESPDMKNIYDGNVVTDEDGNATVELPDYFEALNRDFRYQLTVIGTFAQAIIAAEIKKNRFTIKTNAANVKVSWQVTGIRQDAFANKNRIPLVEAKPEVERGFYLHPEAFNQPEAKSINWARDPERMRQLKQRWLEAEQGRKQQHNQR